MFTSSFYSALFLAASFSNLAAAIPQNAVTSMRTASRTGSRTVTASRSTAAPQASTIALDPNAVTCLITVPNNPLTAEGLATPYILQRPCSMAVGGQQAFVEAAVFDPATGGISIYHPLVTNAGEKPAAAPVVPTLPQGAIVGLWFGFNGVTLQLVDGAGNDANASPLLKSANCVNGLRGVVGDVFGQVSWCNAEQWFTAVNSGINAGSVVVPPLGLDKNGNQCITSRSFSITDADPSDNVPTQYILIGNATAQDTNANRQALGAAAEVINNASDEALVAHILDPLIGCTPFLAPSLDDPGAKVAALALSELQASLQVNPALVPLNDPDCITTKGGAISIEKTNAYRLGVGQPLVGTGNTSGALQPYCNGLVAGTPPFLKGFETTFTAAPSPDTAVGNSLFTFLSARYLGALTNLKCPPPAFQPIVCATDKTGAATSCVITLANTGTVSSKGAVASSTATSAGSGTNSVASSTAAVTTPTLKTTAKAITSALSATLSTTVASSTPAVGTSSKTSAVVSLRTSSAPNKATTTASAAQTTASLPVKPSITTGNVASSGAKAISTPTSALTTLSTPVSSTAIKTLSTAPVASTTIGTTVTKIQVITLELITFFNFINNFGGHLPPAVLQHAENASHFVVIEEIFVDLGAACQRACGIQFAACEVAASLPGAIFSVADCNAQQAKCQGAASTASVTNSVPATVTATATVRAATSAASTKAATAPAAAVTTAAAAQSGQGTSNSNNIPTGVAKDAIGGTNTPNAPTAAASSINSNNADVAPTNAADQCPAPTATITKIPAPVTVSQCTATATATVTSTATVFVTVGAAAPSSVAAGAASSGTSVAATIANAAKGANAAGAGATSAASAAAPTASVGFRKVRRQAGQRRALGRY
jgi:hypothetical protein